MYVGIYVCMYACLHVHTNIHYNKLSRFYYITRRCITLLVSCIIAGRLVCYWPSITLLVVITVSW